MLKGYEKILLLQLRNFGDALIITSLIESIAKSFHGVKIDLFTRPSFEEIFQNNPHINEIYFANFPFMRDKDLHPISTVQMLYQIMRLRTKRYDVCINNQGDFRENLIGRLVNPKRNISIIWDKGHEYRNQIRKNEWFNNKQHSLPVPNNIINIYDINYYIVNKLGGIEFLAPKIYLEENFTKNGKLIAIHPMASQECKLWDFDKWCNLIEELINREYRVVCFCAPHEKAALSNKLNRLRYNNNLNIYAKTIKGFFEKLSHANLFIGLDSFSIHAAYALGIPSILLNGANDHRVFAPSNAHVIHNYNKCDKYPCYNKPFCKGSLLKYNCIRDIPVNDVLEAVGKLMN
jgi:heptosyltransferase III